MSRLRMRFGCLCVSLQYNPVVKKLVLFVLEATDLPASGKAPKKKKGRTTDDDSDDLESDADGTKSAFGKLENVKIDPMVKATLKLDGKKVKKAKTSTKSNTVNPYFNEVLSFEVRKICSEELWTCFEKNDVRIAVKKT